jgi:hypothetical protein
MQSKLAQKSKANLSQDQPFFQKDLDVASLFDDKECADRRVDCVHFLCR